MKFTGEQIIPGVTKQRIEDEHIARYVFALKYVKGKKVLDVACGTGYGTKMLKKFGGASNVVGMDLSKKAIEYAKQNNSLEGVKFFVGNVAQNTFGTDCFDVVVSFETIEHLEEEERRLYLKNIYNQLKKDGIFLISTPNKKIVSPFSDVPINRYHKHEFFLEELKNFVSNFFVIEKILGQRFVHRFFLIFLVRKFIYAIKRYYNNIHIYDIANGPDVLKIENNNREARIFLLVCRKK